MTGIYLLTNEVSGDTYVGSSVRLDHRRHCHLRHIESGTHPNKRIRLCARKHGTHTFVFKIIEQCGVEALVERENFWITKLAPTLNKPGKPASRGRKGDPDARTIHLCRYDPQLVAAVETYREREDLSTVSEAVRRLVRKALKAESLL